MRRSSLEVGQFALLATQHNIVMSDKELLQVLLAACVEPIHEPATSQGVVDATRQKMVLQQLEAKLVEMLEAKGEVDQVAYDAFAKTYNRPPIPNFKPWVVRYVTADTSRFIGVNISEAVTPVSVDMWLAKYTKKTERIDFDKRGFTSCYQLDLGSDTLTPTKMRALGEMAHTIYNTAIHYAGLWQQTYNPPLLVVMDHLTVKFDGQLYLTLKVTM